MPRYDSKVHGRHHRSPTKTPRRGVAGAAAILVLLAWGAPTASAAKSDQQTDSGRMVDIGGGRELLLECRGTGAPTVVLVTGLGERAENWSQTTKPSDERDAVYPN